MAPSPDLQSQCDLLRSLHRPGTPLLLPNVWDVATARAVVAAGFPSSRPPAAAVRRANAYLGAGADCVYPILLWETDALRRFISEVNGPVNVARLPQAPSFAELAAAGVARVSWGTFLHLDAMARFAEQLALLQK